MASVPGEKELELDLETVPDTSLSTEIALGLEDDEQMLEYLQLKCSGQVARAQFLTLIHLCRGTGKLVALRFTM